MGIIDLLKNKETFVIKEDGRHIRINLNLIKIGFKIKKAQEEVDKKVWDDVRRYMPHETGALISETNALQRPGEGRVYAYPPNSDYGHYQSAGIVYKDPVYGVGGFHNEKTGAWWSRPGIKKVPSDQAIKYSDTNARAHWGQYAIDNHSAEWRELARKELRGK